MTMQKIGPVYAMLLLGACVTPTYGVPLDGEPQASLTLERSWGDYNYWKTLYTEGRQQYFFNMDPETCEIIGEITSFYGGSIGGSKSVRPIVASKDVLLMGVVTQTKITLGVHHGDMDGSSKTDCYSIAKFTPVDGGSYTVRMDYKASDDCKTFVTIDETQDAPTDLNTDFAQCAQHQKLIEDAIWGETFRTPGLPREQHYISPS